MAKRLLEKRVNIDALLASPAKRAKKTAELFAETLGKDPGEIIFVSALYHASPDVFYDVIAALPDDLDSVALFSHNPGITYFVNSLDSKTQVDNMPTAAIFAVEADITQWSAFARAKREFLFFDYPKK
jgi:phosphohistidine phosphatase